MELHVGDSLVVKSGVLDPDFGIDISGRQGRIEEVDDIGNRLHSMGQHYPACNAFGHDPSVRKRES